MTLREELVRLRDLLTAEIERMDKCESLLAVHSMPEYIVDAKWHFSVRVENCLSAAGISTISQLTQMSAQDLLKIKNLGWTSVCQIKQRLADNGLHLKEE